MRRKVLLGVSLFLFHASPSFAEEIRTEYGITTDRSGADSKTVFDANAESLTKDFLLKRLQTILQRLPSVSSVQTMLGEEKTESSTFLPYDTKRRISHVVVNLSVGSSVGLLFQVEESYRICVKRPNLDPNTFCGLDTDMRLTGPLKIYGMFTSFADADQLLRDKQYFYIDASQSFDKKELRLSSSLNITSALFDQALMTFVQDFGLSSSVNVEALKSRRTVLSNTARLLRSVKEGVVNEKN